MKMDEENKEDGVGKRKGPWGGGDGDRGKSFAGLLNEGENKQ
jgi:hypothetical protein